MNEPETQNPKAASQPSAPTPTEELAPPTPQHRDPRRLHVFVIGIVIALTGLIVLIVVVRTSAPQRVPSALVASDGASTAGAMVAAEKDRQSFAKAKLDIFLHDGEEAGDALQAIGQELNLWKQNVESALNTDAGRAVTGDSHAVERFHNVYGVPRPTAREIEVHKGAVDKLCEGPRRAMKSGEFHVPDQEAQKEIQSQRAWAETKLAELRRNRQVAEALLHEAAASKLKGTTTLNEAIAQREQKQAESIAEKTVAEEEQARKDAAEAQAKARAEQIRIVGKEEATGTRAQTKNKVLDKRADVTVEDAGAERQRLLKLAKDPAIQAKFQPFLAKGTGRIGTAFTQPYEFPKPASFQLLQHGHALENHENFALAGCGRLNMFGHNDRPRWSKPTNDAELEEMRQRFELFKKLAPIWIEMGLLQP